MTRFNAVKLPIATLAMASVIALPGCGAVTVKTDSPRPTSVTSMSPQPSPPPAATSTPTPSAKASSARSTPARLPDCQPANDGDRDRDIEDQPIMRKPATVLLSGKRLGKPFTRVRCIVYDDKTRLYLSGDERNGFKVNQAFGLLSVWVYVDGVEYFNLAQGSRIRFGDDKVVVTGTVWATARNKKSTFTITLPRT